MNPALVDHWELPFPLNCSLAVLYENTISRLPYVWEEAFSLLRQHPGCVDVWSLAVVAYQSSISFFAIITSLFSSLWLQLSFFMFSYFPVNLESQSSPSLNMWGTMSFTYSKCRKTLYIILIFYLIRLKLGSVDFPEKLHTNFNTFALVWDTTSRFELLSSNLASVCKLISPKFSKLRFNMFWILLYFINFIDLGGSASTSDVVSKIKKYVIEETSQMKW